MSNYYAMILAGGGGTRLWPMSRKDMPKQLLPLIDDQTMFRISVERLLPMFPPENVYIVTGHRYVQAMQADVPEIPKENFIVEPSARDNAAATALGIATIHQRNPNATVVLLPADHYIAKQETFRESLQAAYEIAQEDRIVTLGITPSYPATGFGYIKQGTLLKQVNGINGYHALGFTEKPNVVTASSFLASGRYCWNSGMFIWKTSKALQEFERQQPRMYQLLRELMPKVDQPDYDATLERLWHRMPKISIDYAIMEGASNIAVIPVNIGWSDVGSWSSLFEVLELDQFGNCFRGKVENSVILDTHNTLVFGNRLIVTLGVEDMIVIDTEDALLICHKDRAQDVREVVKHLRATNQDSYL